MDKQFEKILLILMIASSFFLLFSSNSLALKEISSGELQNQYPGITRFHVIANSDSREDQNLKLQVRDYVLEKVQGELGQDIGDGSVNEYVSNNIDQIQAWALEEIQKQGYSYGCTVSLGVKHIPAKYYDDLLFPEGNYQALTITIGQGLGQNWWCVVFPPLCLIDSQDSTYKDQLAAEHEERIILKSKIKELLTASIHKWV